MDNIPYIIYESSQARADKRFRLMWLLIVIMFVALIGTNAGWIVYESQFEDTVITQENDDGYNSFIGNDGDISYGKADD